MQCGSASCSYSPSGTSSRWKFAGDVEPHLIDLEPVPSFQIVTYTADDDGYHANVQYQRDPHYDHPQQKIHPQSLYSHYNPSQHQYQPTHDYKYKYYLATPYQDNATNEMKKEILVRGLKSQKIPDIAQHQRDILHLYKAKQAVALESELQ